MGNEYFFDFIFLIPFLMMLLSFLIISINLKKAGQRPPKRVPTLLKYNQNMGREVIFWPREEDMPFLRKLRRPDLASDPQMGPLIMCIPSRPQFWLLFIFNACVSIICIDAVTGGSLFMSSLLFGYFNYGTYEIWFMALLVLMVLWAAYNASQGIKKILFYEHGLKLLPFQNRKYYYNDIVQIEMEKKKKFLHSKMLFHITFKNGQELMLDSRDYTKLRENIEFWKQNLVWIM